MSYKEKRSYCNNKSRNWTWICKKI